VTFRRLQIWVVALGGLCSFGCKPPEESVQKAIIGAVLIDGTGGPPVSDSVVIVAGSRIRAVGNRANMPIPAGVEKINGMGKFLVPGLIDLHVLPGTRSATGPLSKAEDYTRERIERNLNAYLYFGVTSVRSTWGDRQAEFDVRKAERDGQLQTANLFIAGVGNVVKYNASPEEARQKVDALARQQVDGLVIAYDKPAVIDATIDEARKYKIPVTGESSSLTITESFLRAGAAGFLEMIQDTEDIDAAFIARLRDLRIVFVPALVRHELGWLFSEHPRLLDDPDVARSVDADVIAAARQQNDATPDQRLDFERAMRNTRKLAAGGVLIGVGSDGGSALDFPGLMTHRELELLQEAGLSPMDVIVAATRTGAMALRKTDEMGTIEPGRRADLMLVSANPLEDVRNLRKIDRIMLHGEWVDRDHLALK
jgi:imidazolonepropionase-like amidohydrolase